MAYPPGAASVRRFIASRPLSVLRLHASGAAARFEDAGRDEPDASFATRRWPLRMSSEWRKLSCQSCRRPVTDQGQTCAQARLPQFLIIGAVKAATTWIADQLRARDDVLPAWTRSRIISAANMGAGEDWYASLFAAARPGQLIGEKSGGLSGRGCGAGARFGAPSRCDADRPAAQSGRSRLFRLLHAATGAAMSAASVARYLDAKSGEPRFLQDGLYARHLARWHDYYPAEQLKVILYDDIRAEPRKGADRHMPHPGPGTVDRSGHRSGAAATTAKRPLVPCRCVVCRNRSRISSRRFAAIRRSTRPARLFARPVDYPLMTPDLRMRLSDYYADDVAQLGRLLDRDLSAWNDAARPVR